jgi:hypothetical protein
MTVDLQENKAYAIFFIQNLLYNIKWQLVTAWFKYLDFVFKAVTNEPDVKLSTDM